MSLLVTFMLFPIFWIMGNVRIPLYLYILHVCGSICLGLFCGTRIFSLMVVPMPPWPLEDYTDKHSTALVVFKVLYFLPFCMVKWCLLVISISDNCEGLISFSYTYTLQWRRLSKVLIFHLWIGVLRGL